MKLRLHPSGVAEPIDENGQTPCVEIPLAYHGPSRKEQRVRIVVETDAQEATVWKLAMPVFWIKDAISRAFYFEGAPVSLSEVLDDESEAGAVARADAADPVVAAFEILQASLKRRLALTVSGVAAFERLMRERLPSFMQTLVEDAVTEVRAMEEKKLGLPIPWSERPVAVRRRPGGQPGRVALTSYLKVRARQQRTGESLLKIFAESPSEERVKTRFYDGRRIYRFMLSLR